MGATLYTQGQKGLKSQLLEMVQKTHFCQKLSGTGERSPGHPMGVSCQQQVGWSGRVLTIYPSTKGPNQIQ